MCMMNEFCNTNVHILVEMSHRLLKVDTITTISTTLFDGIFKALPVFTHVACMSSHAISLIVLYTVFYYKVIACMSAYLISIVPIIRLYI
jgi:hypothetical protein